MVASVPPPIEPTAPEWFQRWARRLPDFYQQRFPARPVKVPAFATTADLPAPADFAASIVFHTALGQLCVSDGAHWYPLTMGAHL